MSFNGRTPFNDRDYDLQRRYGQPKNTSKKSQSSGNDGRNYDTGRVKKPKENNPISPNQSASPPPEQDSFFNTLDTLNQLIDQEQLQSGQTQNNPYAASLDRLKKLNNWLDKGTIPAIADIQFEGFAMVNPATPEGADLRQRLDQFMHRLNNSGKGGRIRAQQIKLSVNLDLLNAQKAGIITVLNNLPPGSLPALALESRLAAIENLTQRYQNSLNKLNEKDPSQGNRISKKVFNDNVQERQQSATALYNRARKWAMKILGQYS